MFIRTHRLLLRPPWPEDAEAITNCLADGEIARAVAQVPHPYGIEDAKAFIKQCDAAEPRPTFVILCREGDDAPLAGTISLYRSPEAGAEAEAEAGAGAWELGYWLAKGFRGRGYATEAGRAVLELAFLGLRLPGVVAGHFADNPASGRVLEKLGFVETGWAKRRSVARNCDVDCRNVALTRDGWLAHRSSQVEMHAA